MTDKPRHHEPLDEHERELARVVRALPGGEPSPALDARVLKAAQDAVASRPTVRRLAWIGSSWGIGTAAAAVLAVGVSWQMLQQPAALRVEAPVPASAPAAQELKEERLSVDLVEPPPREYDNSPPPEDQPLADQVPRRQRAQAPASPPPPPSLASQPHPEAFTDEHVDSAPVVGNDFAAAPAPRAEAGRLADAERRDQAGALAKAAAAPAQGQASAAAGAELDEITVTGSRLAATIDPQVYERVKADLRLAPDTWLRRIRSRLDEGDTEGARASLALFRASHPQERVPEALVQRLRE